MVVFVLSYSIGVLHENKYKQVVLETISWTFNGIQRVTYVTWAVK